MNGYEIFKYNKYNVYRKRISLKHNITSEVIHKQIIVGDDKHTIEEAIKLIDKNIKEKVKREFPNYELI